MNREESIVNKPINPMGGKNTLTSKTIEYLRFPLAVMVVFIHSFGEPSSTDLVNIDWSAFSSLDAYNIIRVLISKVISHCAVPVFFLTSGWLFFLKLQDWDTDIWLDKCKKRIHTLLIPYLIWITIAIIWTLSFKIAGVILHGKSWEVISDWFANCGGLRMYWDSSVWSIDRVSFLGIPMPEDGPYLLPFWFLRNLMVAVVLAPFTWWLIKTTKGWLVLLLTIFYLLGIPLSWHGIGLYYWFVLGAWMTIYDIDMSGFCRKYRKLACILFLLLLVPSIIYKGSISNVAYPLNGLYISCLVITFVSMMLDLAQKGKLKILATLSDTTFLIFAVHTLILPYVSKIVNLINRDEGYVLDTLTYFLTPIVTITICVYISKLLKKYMPNLAKILGCR